MKKSNLLLVLSSMMLIASCGKGGASVVPSVGGPSAEAPSEEVPSVETPSGESSADADYGEMHVEDAYAYWMDETPTKVEVSFTKDAEDVEYYIPDSYDEYLTIEDDGTIVMLKEPSVISGSYNNKSHYMRVPCTAATRHHEEDFAIYLLGDKPEFFASSVTHYENNLDAKHMPEGKTLWIGDSFFDSRNFWTNFYNEVGPSGEHYNAGISSSTLESWMTWSNKLIYPNKPANIVINLGTNDLWDLKRKPEVVLNSFKRFTNEIHAQLPECQIYYDAVINRQYTIGGLTARETANYVIEYNSLVSEYIDTVDYIKFVDIHDHFSYSDGSLKVDLTKDGCHPQNSEYAYILEKVAEQGLDVVKNDGFGDITRTTSDAWGSGADLLYKGQNLVKDFYYEGKVKINEVNSNGHMGFHFKTWEERFLLWRSTEAETLYYGSQYGSFVNKSVDSLNYTETTEFTWGLLVSERNAYLFINNVLERVLLNLNAPGNVTIGTEGIGCEITNNVIKVKGDGSEIYETKLASLSKYENDASVAKESIDAREDAPEPSSTFEDFTRTQSDTWGNLVTVKKNGSILRKEFAMSGKIAVVSHGGNAHIGFELLGVGDRFLLWDSSSNGNFYLCGAYGGTYHNTSSRSVDYASGDEFTWTVLVSNRNAYLFVNGELAVVYLNINVNSITFKIGSEAIAASFYDHDIALKGEADNKYETLLGSPVVQTYETDDRTSATYIGL